MATVVIVSRDNMALLKGILIEEGHLVIEAYDSGHVLQHVMRQRLDAIVLPDDMQPVDGEELLPVIRRLTMAAIIVVGEGKELRMAEALLQGADVYLRYPDEAGRLRSRLRSVLRPRRGWRTAARPGDPQANGPHSLGCRYFQSAWCWHLFRIVGKSWQHCQVTLLVRTTRFDSLKIGYGV
ncbi:MAG: response regulator [Dehalococcoidia bacterium]